MLLYKICVFSPLAKNPAPLSLSLFTSKVPGVLASVNLCLSHCIPNNIHPSSIMHLQLFFLALMAPLALSLPQPVSNGESGALMARQDNSTGGGDGGRGKSFGGDHHGPPGHHPERALVERQDSSNSTGGGEPGHPSHHGTPPPGRPHPGRDLTERQDSSNSTGAAGEGGPHHKGGKFHGGPSHPGRDLSERQESGNSTTGGETHGEGDHGHGRDHHGEHKRSIVDMVLNRRQDNSTSSGEEGGRKGGEGKGHFAFRPGHE